MICGLKCNLCYKKDEQCDMSSFVVVVVGFPTLDSRINVCVPLCGFGILDYFICLVVKEFE